MKRALLVLGLVAACVVAVARTARPFAAQKTLEIKTLSTDASRVTGGDVLVQITAPSDTVLKVTANVRDVSNVFKTGEATGVHIGLVTGLPIGKSTLVAEAAGRNKGKAELDITNYPITGPVLSGPWIQPFICQTDAFTLPDGTKLGPPLDANCSARTVVQHV